MEMTRRWALVQLVVLVIGSVVGATSARAEIIVFTDRTAFLNALEPGFFVEDFQEFQANSLDFANRPMRMTGNGFSVDAARLRGSLQFFDLDHGDIRMSTDDPALDITFRSFTGPTPVTAFGGFFYAGVSTVGGLIPDRFGRFNLRAFNGVTFADSDGDPNQFSGTSPATFIGFISTDAPFTTIELGRSNVTRVIVDDLIVGSAALQQIPEPSSFALMAAGMATFGRRLMRRKRKS